MCLCSGVLQESDLPPPGTSITELGWVGAAWGPLLPHRAATNRERGRFLAVTKAISMITQQFNDLGNSFAQHQLCKTHVQKKKIIYKQSSPDTRSYSISNKKIMKPSTI